MERRIIYKNASPQSDTQDIFTVKYSEKKSVKSMNEASKCNLRSDSVGKTKSREG